MDTVPQGESALDSILIPTFKMNRKMEKLPEGETAVIYIQRCVVFDALFDEYILRRLNRRTSFFRKHKDVIFATGLANRAYNKAALRAHMRARFLEEMEKLDPNPKLNGMQHEVMERAFNEAAAPYGLTLPCLYHMPYLI